MKKIIILICTIFISSTIYCQNFDLGETLNEIPETLKLIGISSKDNSKIYRFNQEFPSTVFSYEVDKFEIKIYQNTIVSLHFVLKPKDNTSNVPIELIEKVKLKSGNSPVLKDSKYFFDDISSKTIIFRKNIIDYGGDRIHILTTSTEYLNI